MQRSSRRLCGVTLLGLAAVLLAGCGGGSETASSAQAATPAKRATCPAAWVAGWQKLANRINAAVYCPAWMPSPLTGQITGNVNYAGGGGYVLSVSKDRSYLASFAWVEMQTGEVHVNLRGYPHRTSIPLCRNDEQAGPKRVKTLVPCFSDRKWTKHVGGFKVTLYTVNRDADQWHLLYAWRHAGSLYAISEHVAPPFGYARVLQNLDRMTRNLVPVAPAG